MVTGRRPESAQVQDAGKRIIYVFQEADAHILSTVHVKNVCLILETAVKSALQSHVFILKFRKSYDNGIYIS